LPCAYLIWRLSDLVCSTRRRPSMRE
jgi:hypothetical protein